MTQHLLIIDPQNDFCDLPASARPGGAAPALPVAGAHADMQRLAALIRASGTASSTIGDITVTLDSHHRLDIAHPTFWVRGDGAAVTPFTPITAAQVRAGAFRPRDPASAPRALAYLDELESRGRYTLMVWPVHCEIGSWGHNVHADVRAAYNAWEEQHLRVVELVTKGENPWTEHYSAIMAEVPDAQDAHTQLNRALVERLARADRILVAGEASSHCVKATTEHLVANLPDGARRVTLITDCMSPVGGFEAQHAAFLADLRERGARLATSAELLAG
ncbi:MAG TPA: cysteine hydrolase [Burkholderiaceae bacterium]|jgi:nicotinamidase-related amidase